MFKFGETSEKRLQGVRPELVRVVRRALELSEVDFAIAEGLRSPQRQAELVRQGKSQTTNSRHLTGHAVDIVPFVGGKVDWNTEKNFHTVAEAFREAAIELKTEILWGRAWLKALNYYPSAEAAFEDYVAQRKREGRRPFLDGPHFQLTKNQHP